MISFDRGKLVLLVLLFSLRFLPVRTSTIQTLNLSSTLKVGDTLVSPSGYFELGIFQFVDKYQLCVRYAAPIEQVVTWVANRDIPLSDASYLHLSSPDGNLQLIDPAIDLNKPSWSSANSANAGVGKAKLLDTGNLVLVNSNGSVQIWESFKDIPSLTDTLLPGQYFNRTSSRNLTSWLYTDDPASGPYTFGWGARANMTILQLAWTSPKPFMNWTGGTYIPAPDMHAPRTISGVDAVYFHATLGHLYMTSSPADTVILTGGDDVSPTILKRITLDSDGGFRIWQWTVGTSKKWTAKANWVVSERSDSGQCTAFGTCGQFGLCKSPKDSLDRVQCECPYGFKPLNANDVARGCRPVVPVNNPDCNDTTKVTLFALNETDMPWGGDYFNLTGNNSVNCKEACLNDCQCAGAVYSRMEKRCWMKTTPLYNLGYPTVHLHGTDRVAYLKISSNQPSPVQSPSSSPSPIPSPSSESSVSSHEKGAKLGVIIGPVVGGVFIFVLVVLCCCRSRFQRINITKVWSCTSRESDSRPVDVPEFPGSDTDLPTTRDGLKEPGPSR